MTNRLQIATLETVGERLRYLRSLTRLDRKSFAEQYEIPEVTLRLWETSKAPITEKAINRCVKAYLQEGINVTQQWLQNGIGSLPTLDHALISFLRTTSSSSITIINNIEKDYLHFRNTYPGCILFEITTDEMMPIYKKGDFVMGRVSTNDIKEMHTKDCIIHLISGQVRFRKVFITQQNQVNLYSSNPLAPAEPILNAQIESIAPIMLHYII